VKFRLVYLLIGIALVAVLGAIWRPLTKETATYRAIEHLRAMPRTIVPKDALAVLDGKADWYNVEVFWSELWGGYIVRCVTRAETGEYFALKSAEIDSQKVRYSATTLIVHDQERVTLIKANVWWYSEDLPDDARGS
jgi:hypothetical protein